MPRTRETPRAAVALLVLCCASALAAAQLLPRIPAPAAPAPAGDGSKSAGAARGSTTAPSAATPPAASAAETFTLDPHDGSTPRRAVRGYLYFTRKGDYRSALEYLDLSSLPEAERSVQGPELARQLKVVLDQHLWFGDLHGISDAPAGADDDGLPDGIDVAGHVPLGDERVPLYLGRDEATGRWRFADATLLRLESLYAAHGHPWVERYLPEAFTRIRIREMELWQVLSLLLLVPSAIAVARLLGRLLARPLMTLASRTSTDLDEQLLQTVGPPFRMMLATGLVAWAIRYLGLSVPEQRVAGIVLRVVVFLAVIWLFLRLIDMTGRLVEQRMRERGAAQATAVVPLLRRSLQAVLFIFAAMASLQAFGVSVTGLLAGVSVIGLAVSFAAQKTLENLFGGVSLIVDQPVRVGDYCKFGAVEGTVESIGIRSSRIRTLQRTLVSVPNTMFSTDIIENFGSRDRIRMHQLLNLRYETTSDQLRFVLSELRRLLSAHAAIDQAMPTRVRFVAFGSSSLDVEFAAYAATSNFEEFLGIREDVYLRVMDIVAEAGTGFAFPSRTLYLGRDGGLDAERAKEAAGRIAALRGEGRLPFPTPAPEDESALRGTIPFPPEGSVAAVAERDPLSQNDY